ncbi:hypothetical protein C2G38_2066766 [Gigaspora rosea]|uniref:Uncharacterized protein n=1 Tax=Gigaspora rosea TaxID=44941 RepID=A0A397VXL7_9GLOM|nr:hypothetical protein C2G38_2066766 [Gigaspora rosea]
MFICFNFNSVLFDSCSISMPKIIGFINMIINTVLIVIAKINYFLSFCCLSSIKYHYVAIISITSFFFKLFTMNSYCFWFINPTNMVCICKALALSEYFASVSSNF